MIFKIALSLNKLIHCTIQKVRLSRKANRREIIRLSRMPRYRATYTNLLGPLFELPDAASFLASWEEIFERQIYDFKTISDHPRILDCGSNVGVSCVFFKKRFPNSRITAFEPDPKIFAFLQKNMSNHGLTDVEQVNKAVWISQTTLKFECEGSDAGRIVNKHFKRSINVESIRLRDYLVEPIDLLKIDIEGAESEVISDIAPLLSNVKNLFVEYHSFMNEPQSLDTLIGILAGAGYRLQIQHVSFSSKPFIELQNHLEMDLQLNIFAFRP